GTWSIQKPFPFTKPIRFSSFIHHVQEGSRLLNMHKTKPVQSTSMSRNLTLALLASASFLCIGVTPAAAGEPNVVYANDPQATAVRSNMGGGFVQFLFGDTPQSRRYY